MNELDIIKHDIRNYKELTNKQINFILNISNSDKDKVIILYNEMMKYINDILNEENYNKK